MFEYVYGNITAYKYTFGLCMQTIYTSKKGLALFTWKSRSSLKSRATLLPHYNNVIMGAIASQTTSLTIVYSTVYSDADQRKHQNSASLAFVWWIHRGPVNSPCKWPVTRKMSPFDDVILQMPYWVCLTELPPAKIHINTSWSVYFIFKEHAKCFMCIEKKIIFISKLG